MVLVKHHVNIIQENIYFAWVCEWRVWECVCVRVWELLLYTYTGHFLKNDFCYQDFVVYLRSHCMEEITKP